MQKSFTLLRGRIKKKIVLFSYVRKFDIRKNKLCARA